MRIPISRSPRRSPAAIWAWSRRSSLPNPLPAAPTTRDRLAADLAEALRLLRESKPLVDLFGDRFVLAYTAVKEAEYETFAQVISSWEREHLLLNV